MAQAVSRWPLTAEARVLAWVDPCGICGGRSGTGAGFSPSSSVLLCQYHSAIAPFLSITAPMRCAIAPTEQRIITTWVLSQGLHF
jgi:hypothetical protein